MKQRAYFAPISDIPVKTVLGNECLGIIPVSKRRLGLAVAVIVAAETRPALMGLLVVAVGTLHLAAKLKLP